MQINGTVVSVEFDQTIPKVNGGSYQGTRLMYRDDGGQLKEQNFTNQTLKYNAQIKSILSNLSAGEKFVMTKEKESEFWNVKAIQKANEVVVGGPQMTAGGATKPTASPKSTYETPEERARRQVLIVRQSSISSAVEFVNGLSKTAEHTPEKVVEVARIFESFVMGTDEVGMATARSLATKALVEMEDDIPM